MLGRAGGREQRWPDSWLGVFMNRMNYPFLYFTFGDDRQ